MGTKERILFNALELFSKSGYNAISIRDIARSVNIKESSIYYHFDNKQDILNSIVERYEFHIKELLDILDKAIEKTDNANLLSFDVMKNYFFEQYLFDPFCNRMMRFMLLEQFHNKMIQTLYNKYLFELPEKIQMHTLRLMCKKGFISECDVVKTGRIFFSMVTSLTFRYLLNGELTDAKKEAFCKDIFFLFDSFEG